MKCKNCIWFDKEHESLVELNNAKFGYCRKHKPVIFQTERASKWWYGGWPLVDINDMCGEIRRKEG